MRNGPTEANESSIKNLKSLLTEICENPKIYINDMALKKSLETQGGLSRYSNEVRGISSSSLNTHKRICQSLYPSGYRELDELRIRALQGLSGAEVVATTSDKRSKKGLHQRVKNQDAEILQGLSDCWHLTTAFSAAVHEGRLIAQDSDNPALKARWEKKEKELMAMFSLAKQPLGKKLSDGKSNDD